jgi:hypothetical protein
MTRVILGIGLAAIMAAFGAGPTVAEEASETKTCIHEDKTYEAGEVVVVDGMEMVCDGATGTWVPAEPAEPSE